MEQIIPNRHKNSVNISFIISENVASTKTTFKILINDTKGYNLLKREVEITVKNVKYNATVFVGKMSTKNSTPQYYLEVLNHKGFAINDVGSFNLNFQIKQPNDNITIQDVVDILSPINKQNTEKIGDIEVQTIPSLHELNIKGEYIKSPKYDFDALNNSNLFIELIKNKGIFSIKGEDDKGVTILNLVFEVSYINGVFVINKTNLLNTYINTICFEFIVDNDDKIFMRRVGVLSNSPFKQPLNSKFVIESFITDSNVPLFDDGNIKSRLETTNLSPIEYPNRQNYTHILQTDVVSIGENYIDSLNNNGVKLTDELCNGKLDFNDIIFLDKINSNGLSVLTKLVNAPSDIGNDWTLTNTFHYNINDGNFYLIQTLYTLKDIYFRTKSTTFTAWVNTYNKKIYAKDILTDNTHLFVTQNDINRWNENINSSTWLAPITNKLDLPLDDVFEGSIIFVISEQILYKYVGGKWLPIYGKASASNDGILSKEDYQKFSSLSNVEALFKRVYPNKSVYSIESTNAVYDTLTDLINGVIQSSKVSEISDKVVMIGINTTTNNTVDNKSKFSTIYGIDNTVRESQYALLFGTNNSVNKSEKGIAVGHNLNVTNITKTAIGKFNKGQYLFEIGDGTANDKRSNLFAIDSLKNLIVERGILGLNLSKYTNEDGVEIDRDSRYTTYTINGDAYDLNTFYGETIELKDEKLIFYKLGLINNPDYEIDDEGNPIDPNIPEFIKDKVIEIPLTSGISLMYDTNKRIVDKNDNKVVIAQTPIYEYQTISSSEMLVTNTFKIGRIINNSVFVLISEPSTSERYAPINFDIIPNHNESIVIRLVYPENWDATKHADYNVPIRFQNTNLKIKCINPEYDNKPTIYGNFGTALITRFNNTIMIKISNGIMK